MRPDLGLMNSKVATARLDFVEEIYRSTRNEIFQMHRDRRDFLEKIQDQLQIQPNRTPSEMLIEPKPMRQGNQTPFQEDLSSGLDCPCDSESLDQLDHLAELLQRKLHLNVVSTASDKSFGLTALNTSANNTKTLHQPSPRHSNFWNRYLQKLPLSSCSKDFRPSDWLMCIKPKGVRCVYTVFPGKSILIEVEGKCTQFRFNPLEKFLNQSVSNPKSIFDCVVATKGNKRIVYILDMIMLDGNPLFEIPAEVRDFFLTGRLAQKMNLRNVEICDSTSYSLNDHPQLEIRVLKKFECNHQNALRLKYAAQEGDGLILMDQSEGYSLNTLSHNFIWVPTEPPKAQIEEKYNPPRIKLEIPLVYLAQSDSFITLTPPDAIHYPYPPAPSQRTIHESGLQLKPSHHTGSTLSNSNSVYLASPMHSSPTSPPNSPQCSSMLDSVYNWTTGFVQNPVAEMLEESWSHDQTNCCTLDSQANGATTGRSTLDNTTTSSKAKDSPGSDLKPQTPNTPTAMTYNVSTPNSLHPTQNCANSPQTHLKDEESPSNTNEKLEEAEHPEQEHVEAASVSAVCWERKGVDLDGIAFKDGNVYLVQVVVVIGKNNLSEDSGAEFRGVDSQTRENGNVQIDENQGGYCWFRLGRQIIILGEYPGQALTWQDLVDRIRIITHPLYYASLLEMLKS